jgi:hypothetical protein
MLFVPPSEMIAIPSPCPAITPTRAKGGRFASDGKPEDCCTDELGRRVAEKIGRFLVALNEDKGMAHNGLACPVGPCDFVPIRSVFVDTVPFWTIPMTSR